jgi:neutral ceramidase
VDITPPPGIPKSGHSTQGCRGTGVRGRLRAKAIHLRAGRSSVALVVCDLLSGSSAVSRLAAVQLRETTDVPFSGLVVSGTHTHLGPGGYYGAEIVNRLAASSSGFDPQVTRQIADGVTEAVRRSVERRRPAVLAFGRRQLWGVTRNRSLRAHLRNTTVDGIPDGEAGEWLAINPWLHLLRIDAAAADGGFEPLATGLWYSIHPTSLHSHHGEYSGDVFTYITGGLARRIAQSHGTRPVVSGIQGTHGDVEPAATHGHLGHPESRRLGERIAAAAHGLYDELEPQLRGDLTIGCAMREVDYHRDRSIDGITIASRPAFGMAGAAGAREHPNGILFKLPYFKAWMPKRRPSGEHGVKRILLTRWLQQLILPRRIYPATAAAHLLRIGDTCIAAIPFELTVETGRRIERAIVSATGVEHVIVGSVTGEYSHYATTPEEYSQQGYEGGATQPGPNSEPFLTAHAHRLAAELPRDGHLADVQAERSFKVKVKRFWPQAEGRTVTREFLGPARFSNPTTREHGICELRFRDVDPATLRWNQSLAQIEAQADDGSWALASIDGEPLDDQGWRIGVTHLGPDQAGHLYAVRWYAPEERALGSYRFKLLANAEQPELVSEAV